MKKPFSLLFSVLLTVSLCSLPAQAAVPSGPDQLCSQAEWELLKQTNKERLAAGLLPYSTFPALQQAADTRTTELTSLYSHTRPDGTECFTALTQNKLSYRSAGENIAAGQATPDKVMEAWLNSEGHRENILDEKFSHMGTGYIDQPCTIVNEGGSAKIPNGWVQLFLTNDCSITSISLSKEAAVCPTGSTPESLDLYIQATCSAHGSCYLPLVEGMYTDFDPNTNGTQTVTVSYGGKTASLTLRVGGNKLDTTEADSWAVNWLEQADALGLLSERNRTGFTANVTRLQFADLAVSLAEALTKKPITPAEEAAFTDTTEEVIRKAKAAGIASGYQVEGGFQFRPGNSITRQEICVMLAHVADYVNASASLDRTETVKGTFTDTDKVAGWAVKQVALMANNGVMGGKATEHGPALEPESNTTLQEAITLIVKLNDILH